MNMRIVLFLLLALNCAGQPFTFEDQAFLQARNPSVAPAYQPETVTYYNNITNNGGTISTHDLELVDTFVIHAKTNGYWSYLLDCSPFAGDNTNAAVVKLKTMPGSTQNLLINHGFKAADWRENQGWNNAGTNNFSTGVTNLPAYFCTNGMSVWLTYPTTNLVLGILMSLMGHDSTYGNSYSMSIGGYGAGEGSVVQSMATVSLVSDVNGTYIPGQGLYGFTRTATNLITIEQNGLVLYQDPTVRNGTTVTDIEPVTIFGKLQGGAANTVPLTNNPLGWYALEGGIPTNDLTAYAADLLNLESGLGRCAWQSGKTIKCFLIVGQSLSCGYAGIPPNNTNYGPDWIGMTNQSPWIMYNGGPLVPSLLMPSGGGGRPAGNSIAGYTEYATSIQDTGWRAFGEHLHWCITNGGFASEPILFVHAGQISQGYSVLSKESLIIQSNSNPTLAITNIYGYSIADLIRLKNSVANLWGANLNIEAIIACHGETDNTNDNYEANVEQWVSDYNFDIHNITGQTNSVMMFAWQPSSFTWPVNVPHPAGTIGMMNAALDNPGSNAMAGPRYQIPIQGDNLHLAKFVGYNWQGEYSADIMYNWLWLTNTYQALIPTNITRVGTNITLTYNHPALVWDTNLVTYQTNYGFNYTNSLGLTNIYSVILGGVTTNQVIISLASTPSVTGTVSYALFDLPNTNTIPGFTNATWQYQGVSLGPRGNLRDQYPHTGFVTTSNLYNWGCIFQRGVN